MSYHQDIGHVVKIPLGELMDMIEKKEGVTIPSSKVHLAVDNPSNVLTRYVTITWQERVKQ